jgi:hypothetical protein
MIIARASFLRLLVAKPLLSLWKTVQNVQNSHPSAIIERRAGATSRLASRREAESRGQEERCERMNRPTS